MAMKRGDLEEAERFGELSEAWLRTVPAAIKEVEANAQEAHAFNQRARTQADAAMGNDLRDAEVTTLQGIGGVASGVLKSLGIKTVRDLASYKYFRIARSIHVLSETETEGGRPAGSVMNIDKAVDKAWESSSLGEIVKAPPSALQGIGPEASAHLEKLGVKTVGDLATFKYCRWAESIATIADYEEV